MLYLRFILVNFIFFLSSYDIHAQNCNFIKYYFDYIPSGFKSFHAADLIHTSDNAFVMVGTVYSTTTGGVNYFILKTNSFGDTLWYRENSSIFLNDALYVIETSDSCYILATNLTQIHLVKYDKNGNFIWERFQAPGSPSPSNSFYYNSVIEVNSAIYVFAIDQYPNGFQKGILFKTNLNGDSLMTLYDTPFLCGYNNNSTLLYDNDKIAIGGHAYDSLNSYYVSKFFIIDITGIVLHEKVIHDQSEDFGFLLKQSHDSLYYFLSMGSSSALYKLDSLGNIIWFNDNIPVDVNSSLCLPDTNLILITSSVDGQTYLSSSGQYSFTSTLNCPFGIDRQFSKALISGNELILGGMAQDTSTLKYGCFIAKFDVNTLTSLSDNEDEKHVILYPNPVRPGEKLYIYTQGMIMEEINVFDLMGRKVENISSLKEQYFSLLVRPDKHPPGYYIVFIKDKNGLMIKRSFIVN